MYTPLDVRMQPLEASSTWLSIFIAHVTFFVRNRLRIDQVEYIVFDYAPGGDLFDALEASTGGVSLEKCRFYMRGELSC